MRLVILTNELLKEELLAQGLRQDIEMIWVNSPLELLHHPGADAYIDLLFNGEPERIRLLQQASTNSIIVNDVTQVNELPSEFVLINGWTTFLKRNTIEASCKEEKMQSRAEHILDTFNKKIEWMPVTPGFITARVVAMIINEAYFSLAEQVSTKKEIDIAMKMGTNYPYGPFEWSERIGLKNVYELLHTLSMSNSRYEPAALLKKEVFAA